MTFLECIKMAFQSMKMNKMRSFLTMLGIIIGISSVITISTIGTTLKATISSSLYGMGTDTIDLYLSIKDYEKNSDYKITESDYITDEMLEGLVEKYPDDYELIDCEFLSECTSTTENNTYTHNVMGIQPGYMRYSRMRIIKGRGITTQDTQLKKSTAIVSEVFEKQYCPNGSIIGETISLNGDYNFSVTVVGVYRSKDKLRRYEGGEKDVSTVIYIPISFANKLQNKASNSYSYIEIQPNPGKNAEKLTQQAQKYFDKLYENNEFVKVEAFNYGEVTKIYIAIVDILSFAFSLIAAISLIVGGVGVMNIMLVSVVERTSEIGIRKALGAKSSAIKRQFVMEAIIICLIGGIIGIFLGLGASYLLGEIAKTIVNGMDPDVADTISIVTSPSIPAIIISVIVSILTGVIFGSSPAKRAAKMNPIDALRFE